MATPLDLITEDRAEEPLLDAAISAALLHAVGAGARGDALRIFRPGATLAFGRLDARADGFAAACAAARARGYEPLVRSAGGHAAAYDRESLVIEHVVHEPGAMATLQPRFAAHARRLRDALRSLGADARIGELPGEYCPGQFSVNVAGHVKVAGVAQRVIKDAALTTAVLVVGRGAPLRGAIAAVYEALAIPIDPTTAGSLDETLPAVTTAAAEAAVRATFAAEYRLLPAALDAALLDAARERVAHHRPPPGR